MSGQAIVTIENKQWSATIADTPWELAHGLGGVPELASGYGMLFDTGWTHNITVTTESMLFPLDIAFLSESLNVVDLVQHLVQGHRLASAQPARYFLEVNAGEMDGIGLNDQATIDIVALQEWSSWEVWMADMWNMMMAFLPLVIVGGFTIGIIRAGISHS